MSMVRVTAAAVLWDMAMCSSCFFAHSLSGSGREHARSIPFSEVGSSPVTARCLMRGAGTEDALVPKGRSVAGFS
jgi:hypothetical protein